MGTLVHKKHYDKFYPFKVVGNHYIGRLPRHDGDPEYDEVDVYENYIDYKYHCLWYFENYYKFEYRVKWWWRLFVKCTEFIAIDNLTPSGLQKYKFIVNWKYNPKEMKRYFVDQQYYDLDRKEAEYKFKYRDRVLSMLERFDFRNFRRYYNNLRLRIVEQIENGNFKH